MSQKENKLTVTVIADYGPLSDMAFAEVTQNIYNRLSEFESHVKEYSVPPFDTVATGFFLAELAINSELGDKHFFFVNTAPRHDDQKPREDAAGEKLVYMELHNGVQILAVNSGHSLSFVKEAAKKIRVVNVENEGSQFRSRDFYPKVLGEIARGDMSRITNRKPKIADIPENTVALVDGYGNIKTTIDPKTLGKHLGKYMTIEINDKKHFVKAGKSIFDVPDGLPCIAKGSSGWTLPNGLRREFAEVVIRSGNAYKAFDRPKGGQKIKITPAP
jgi:hypothetical protein